MFGIEPASTLQYLHTPHIVLSCSVGRGRKWSCKQIAGAVVVVWPSSKNNSMSSSCCIWISWVAFLRADKMYLLFVCLSSTNSMQCYSCCFNPEIEVFCLFKFIIYRLSNKTPVIGNWLKTFIWLGTFLFNQVKIFIQ